MDIMIAVARADLLLREWGWLLAGIAVGLLVVCAVIAWILGE